MSKRRRGMSLEEKRQVMLGILQETKEVFDLKELEKLGNKAGVVANTVKDVLQSLVDDDLIRLDKIGIKNMYWSFPADAYMTYSNRAEKAEASIEEDEKAVQDLEAELAKVEEGRVESEERTEGLAKLAALQVEIDALTKEVDVLKDNDPEVLEEVRTKVELVKTAANRWTDNIFTLKDYCKKKYGMDSKTFDQALRITDDFDYVDAM